MWLQVTFLPIERVLAVVYPYFEVPKNFPRSHPPPISGGTRRTGIQKFPNICHFSPKKDRKKREFPPGKKSPCPKKFPGGIYVGPRERLSPFNTCLLKLQKRKISAHGQLQNLVVRAQDPLSSLSGCVLAVKEELCVFQLVLPSNVHGKVFIHKCGNANMVYIFFPPFLVLCNNASF